VERAPPNIPDVVRFFSVWEYSSCSLLGYDLLQTAFRLCFVVWRRWCPMHCVVVLPVESACHDLRSVIRVPLAYNLVAARHYIIPCRARARWSSHRLICSCSQTGALDLAKLFLVVDAYRWIHHRPKEPGIAVLLSKCAATVFELLIQPKLTSHRN
jgi:hypothetical protein